MRKTLSHTSHVYPRQSNQTNIDKGQTCVNKIIYLK